MDEPPKLYHHCPVHGIEPCGGGVRYVILALLGIPSRGDVHACRLQSGLLPRIRWKEVVS